MLPKRKQPRLSGHDYSSGGVYFITICTNNKEKLLGTIPVADSRDDLTSPEMCLSEYGKITEDAIAYLSENTDYLSECRYVIMTNHIHLLININPCGADGNPRPTEALVPKLIASLKRFTSRKAGIHLWQASYYDHIVRSEDDYLRICKYIEDNPYKWADDDYYL